MNIHPIFVHFPIALFTVYAVIELIWNKSFRANISTLWIKVTLLATGIVGAQVSLMTGETAEHLIGESTLIEKHSTFANFTVWIFGILLVSYMLHILDQKIVFPKIKTFLEKRQSQDVLVRAWGILVKMKDFLIMTPIVYILAIVGLLAVTVTGALGGAIVYGPEVDPIVQFVYSVLM